jgi:RNA polymerase sigma factor (sigma-70 family)
MSRERFGKAANDDALVVPAQRPASPSAAVVERAFAAHHRDVYRYVLALTCSTSDADEVTAEVFERALRSWQAEPERVLPWLLLTARRIATDRRRRAVRLVRLLPRLRGGEHTDPGEGRAEFWSWFDAMSRVLTKRQREVLVLRYQRDLTDEDIAAILGLSESGVRSLVSRALDALRAHPDLL